jgi:transcriptional regulator with AAA-type ATPase domain
MKNRFRIEIYDDIKSNDLTIFADNNVDRELLSEYVFGNIRNFNTTVHAYVFDTLKKKKTAAMFLPMETVQSIKSKMSYPSKLFS